MTDLKTGPEEGGQHSLQITIEGRHHSWHKQYISGAEIRKLGEITDGIPIFLANKKPWEDELIEDAKEVDLARPGIEHFFTKEHHHGIVTISVNDKPHEIHRGKHPVSEIKRIGGVPPAHELEEIIEGILTPLDDNGHVTIKGGEEFFGHVRDGASS